MLVVVLVDADERAVLLHEARARLLSRLHILIILESRVDLDTVVLTSSSHHTLLIVPLSAASRVTRLHVCAHVVSAVGVAAGAHALHHTTRLINTHVQVKVARASWLVHRVDHTLTNVYVTEAWLTLLKLGERAAVDSASTRRRAAHLLRVHSHHDILLRLDQ